MRSAFLYKQVLEVDLPWMEELPRPTRPPRVPTVLTQDEVAAVLGRLQGVYSLIACLLYGTGMRLMECMTLRVTDVDFGRREIVIREGQGGRGRRTMLPLSLMAPLREHLAVARKLLEKDRICGRPEVMLPYALKSKYPHAGQRWAWF